MLCQFSANRKLSLNFGIFYLAIIYNQKVKKKLFKGEIYAVEINNE